MARYSLRRILVGAALLGVALLLAPRTSPAQSRLTAADLHYVGAFAFPLGTNPDHDEWAYSGQALAYYPHGDPTGPADRHPGSLFCDGHDWDDQVGELSIPAPVLSRDFSSLPQATILTPLADITGGWIANCNHDGSCSSCEFREVSGLAYLHNVDKVAWNLRDWYNVGGCDLDSLGWSDRDLTGAAGIWHIGARPSTDNEYHNAKTCDYLFKAPEAFATQHLGGRWLIAGNHRQAGAFGGSQGPTLVATAPWLDGSPPATGHDLGATALVYYPEVLACANNQFEQCYYPGYRVDDAWGGGAWVEVGGKRAVLVFGRKGLGDNCYGTPGVNCPTSACSISQGWHSPPYEPQILFYDPADIVQVVDGTMEPWEVLPYEIHRPTDVVFSSGCPRLRSVAYDSARQLVYVTESRAGPYGETAVHVWAMGPDIFADDFESGDTSQWSLTVP
jgi:hypothetical protein